MNFFFWLCQHLVNIKIQGEERLSILSLKKKNTHIKANFISEPCLTLIFFKTFSSWENHLIMEQRKWIIASCKIISDSLRSAQLVKKKKKLNRKLLQYDKSNYRFSNTKKCAKLRFYTRAARLASLIARSRLRSKIIAFEHRLGFFWIKKIIFGKKSAKNLWTDGHKWEKVCKTDHAGVGPFWNISIHQPRYGVSIKQVNIENER